MAAGTWTFTNTTRTKILDGTFASGSSFKMALFVSTSNLTTASTTFAGVTNEVGTTNTGYTAGGVTTAITLTGTTSVTWSFTANPTWTAGSANLTAKWALDCDTTASLAVAFVTLDSGGADVTTTSGQVLTIADATGNPVFTFA